MRDVSPDISRIDEKRNGGWIKRFKKKKLKILKGGTVSGPMGIVECRVPLGCVLQSHAVR